MGHFATQRKKNPFSEEKKTLTSKPLFSLTLSLLSFVSLLSLSSTSLCFSGGFCCWLLGVSGAARVLLETWSFWLLLLSLVWPLGVAQPHFSLFSILPLFCCGSVLFDPVSCSVLSCGFTVAGSISLLSRSG